MRLALILFVLGAATLAIVAICVPSNYVHSLFLNHAELTLQPSNQHLAPPVNDCSGLLRQLVLSTPPPGSPRSKPAKSATPLSADEIAIYRVVLKHWISNENAALNISTRTFPLDTAPWTSGTAECNCLKGFQAEALVKASRSFHVLTREVLPYEKMRLVDPKKQLSVVRSNDPDRRVGTGKSVTAAVRDAFANGLFELSEIGFDKDYHHALVSYSFYCGSLCGNGGTFLLEKVGNEWKKTDLACGGWVS